jgi:hypothetical protein
MSGGYWWSISGLISDIVGASLLAVEAIKLENIRKLAEQIRIRVELPLSRHPSGLTTRNLKFGRSSV